MFGFFTKTKTNETTLTVQQLPNGRFGIVAEPTGTLHGTYARKRDAVRGAQRKGLTLVD